VNLRVRVQIADALHVHHHELPPRRFKGEVSEGVRRVALVLVLDVAGVVLQSGRLKERMSSKKPNKQQKRKKHRSSIR